MSLREQPDSDSPSVQFAPETQGGEVNDRNSSSIRRFFAGLRHPPATVVPGAQAASSAPVPGPPKDLTHDLNNVLGIVIGCFDEQLEMLAASDGVDQEKIKRLAEEGLAAALRGAALTRRSSGTAGG